MLDACGHLNSVNPQTHHRTAITFHPSVTFTYSSASKKKRVSQSRMKCQMACLDTNEEMLSLNGELGGKGDLCNVFSDSQNSIYHSFGPNVLQLSDM